jgi:ATP-binding cassette subfamily B protein
LAVVSFFAWLLYKKDLKFRRISEKEIEKEDIIINNRDLIIKKGEVTPFQKRYEKSVNQTKVFGNKKDLTYTLSWVVPSYSFITYADFVFLPLVLGRGTEALTAMKMFNKVFSGGKKSVERLRDFPYYLSAKKRLNDFVALPERDDIQKNISISEPAENITLQKVSFAYEKNKPVWKKLDWEFRKGKVNHLTGENGFGKSTIISLIMGLYQPQKGKILVNNKYKLSELNLIK